MAFVTSKLKTTFTSIIASDSKENEIYINEDKASSYIK